MFYRSCSSSHTEHDKIGFAMVRFFYDFKWILQVTGSKGKNQKNLFLPKSQERFEPSHNSPWVLHSSPRKIPIITSVPFCRGEGSPAAIVGRAWTTNGTGLSKCSPHIDWLPRWGRIGLRLWSAAKQWWHSRRGSGSGAMQVRLGHRVHVGDQVGARGKLRVAGSLWAWAEQQEHRRHQWCIAAGGGVARMREEMRQGGLYAPWRIETVSPHLRGLHELQHGRGVVVTCGGAGGQWRMAVRPPASAHRPRGTGLSSLLASLALDAQWRRARASDCLVLWRLGVRARPVYGAADVVGAWRDVTRGFAQFKNRSTEPSLNQIFSRFWNRRAPTVEYKSCSPTNSLPNLQKL
jgi:hypothetical protein